MLAVVTNLPGWRVASPASDLEKAPDADWPLYPTTLPVLPVMFGPNITGTFTSMYVSASGAFAVTSSGQCSLGNGYGSTGADFDASRSSGIYGSSQTVQPASLRVMAIIKS